MEDSLIPGVLLTQFGVIEADGKSGCFHGGGKLFGFADLQLLKLGT